MMNKDIQAGLAWAGGMLAVAVAAVSAHKLGYMDSETVTRVVIGINGLMMVWYGNRTPKAFIPSAKARQLARVSGWSQVLSGLTYAGLWAFAPLPVAIWGGCAAVLAGIAVTMGYALSLRSQGKASA